MSDVVLSYLAGVIDSDGYIGVQRSTYGQRTGHMKSVSYSPRIICRQVTPEAVDLLHETFPGYRTTNDPSAKRGRPLHHWSVHSAAAGRCLEALLPFLRIKRDRATNAIEVCRLNTSGRRFDVPAVDPAEPMVTMAEAARVLGKGYGTVIQAVRTGSVPHVRTGPRKVLIPESYLPVWAERGSSPQRPAHVTSELERCYRHARKLNRVGV